MSEYLRRQLEGPRDKHAIIGDIHGKGLFLGIECVRDTTPKQPFNPRTGITLGKRGLEHGLLTHYDRTGGACAMEFKAQITWCARAMTDVCAFNRHPNAMRGHGRIGWDKNVRQRLSITMRL